MPIDKLTLTVSRLKIVESVARLGSFSAAAATLRMTQPAVSMQIAQLEEELQVRLFTRQHRGVVLTEAGLALYETARLTLGAVQATLDRISHYDKRQQITVLTDYAFASDWLEPRLSAFSSLYPHAEIRLLTAQSSFASGETRPDITILFGDAPATRTPGRQLLFEEAVFPVCTPDFMATHGPFLSIDDFARVARLHLHGPPRRWCIWDDWFTGMGRPPPAPGASRSERAYGNYPLLMQAVLRGEGMALGWHPLIDQHVAAGRLVRAWPEPLRSRRGYIFENLASGRHAPELFKTWLLGQVRAASGTTDEDH